MPRTLQGPRPRPTPRRVKAALCRRSTNPQRRQAGWRERRAAPLLRGGVQSYQRSSSQPGQRRGGPSRAAAGALGDALGSGGTAAAARRHGRGSAGAALYRRLYANPHSRKAQAARSRWGARGGAYAAPPAPPVAAQPPLSVSHEEDESVSYGETRPAARRTAAEDAHAASWAAGGASKWRSAAPVVMLHATPPDSSDAKDDAADEPPAQRLVQQRLARQGWEAPARIAPLAQAAPRGNAAASPPREDEEAEEEEQRQAAARKRQRRSAHADQPSRRAGAASGGAAIRLGPRPSLAAHLTRRR